MACTRKKRIANHKNYGSKRSTQLIRWIVWHFTGNNGDTDENNGNYFEKNIVKASAHYFADSDSITQSVPDNYVAWSVGGNKYSDCSKTGGGSLFGVVTNTNSISIELCDDIKDGVVYPSAATIANALELTKELMQKYNIPADHVIRHFDVTGKRCPAYWCGSAAKDALWKEIVINQLTGVKVGVNTSTKQPTAKNLADNKKLTLDGSWGKDTTKKTQMVYGTKTDGSISNQPNSIKKYLPNASTTSWRFKPTGYTKGSDIIRAIQSDLLKKKYYDYAIDGWCGGRNVAAMQKFLAKKKYYTGAIDGSMGRQTVIAWQKYINTKL